MEDIDYTIGDDIVCVSTHPRNVVKEGEVYIAKDIRPSNCKCSGYIVDIGKRTELTLTKHTQCTNCKKVYPDDGIYWFSVKRFKKLDNLVNIGELLELLEESIHS